MEELYGPLAHLAKCGEDSEDATLYRLEEYGHRIGLSFQVSSDGEPIYILRNKNNPSEKLIVNREIVDVLTLDFTNWDMMGSDLNYESWKSKMDLVRKISPESFK